MIVLPLTSAVNRGFEVGEVISKKKREHRFMRRPLAYCLTSMERAKGLLNSHLAVIGRLDYCTCL
jgi:hypothetical protein